MDTYWQEEFRQRMERFGAAGVEGLAPVSIKIRVTSGCFHREHSREAYRIIDNYVSEADLSDIRYQIEEHESGPELLVWLAVVTAGLTFAKSVVELIDLLQKYSAEAEFIIVQPGDQVEPQ